MVVGKLIGGGKADWCWKSRFSNMVVKWVSIEKSQLVKEYHELKRKKMCRRCKDLDAAILFLPCRHLTMCEACSSLLDNCNHCGNPIIATVKVYFS